MLKVVNDIPARVALTNDKLSPMTALRACQWNALELLPQASLQKPVISGRAGARFHFIMHPPLLRHILRDRFEDYPKADTLVDIARSVAGDTIVASHGETWKKMRESMVPAFRASALAGYSDVFSSAAENACARLKNGPAEISHHMTETAYEVIANVLLSGLDAVNSRTTRRALDAFRDETARFSPLDFMNAPRWIPRVERLGTPPAIAYGQRLVDDLIARRKAGNQNDPPDILDHMLAAQANDPDHFLTDLRIRDNVTTMLIAGHETTASTLSWALYLCAFDPQIQRAAQLEAQSVLQGRIATCDDLPALPLTRQILDETMRLYPAFSMLARKSTVKETVHGVDIRRNDQMIIPVYALHRNKLLWDNPDSFQPSRFDGSQKIDKYSYMPFGVGPRVCIGASFAVQEAQVVLATLLSRFRFSLIEGRTPQPTLRVTLYSRSGIHLNVERIDGGCEHPPYGRNL